MRAGDAVEGRVGQDGEVGLQTGEEFRLVVGWQLRLGWAFERYRCLFVPALAFPAEDLPCAFEPANDDLSRGVVQSQHL